MRSEEASLLRFQALILPLLGIAFVIFGANTLRDGSYDAGQYGSHVLITGFQADLVGICAVLLGGLMIVAPFVQAVLARRRDGSDGGEKP